MSLFSLKMSLWSQHTGKLNRHCVHATQTKDHIIKGIQSHTGTNEQSWAAIKFMDYCDKMSMSCLEVD